MIAGRKPTNVPSSDIVIYKCKGVSSIGSNDRHQYSQAKFSAENHDILKRIHCILLKLTSSILKITSFKFTNLSI